MPDATAPNPVDDLIVLATTPLVAESPLRTQGERLTPNDRFFIRNHFGIPDIAASEWQLALGPGFNSSRSISLADLRPLPSRTVEAVVECAGNGRSFLQTPWEGNAFAYGAVSAATWTGVSVSNVLALAGVPANAVEVVFVGTDHGFDRNAGADIPFERSLPLEVAMHPDTILAFAMNGESLPRDHGGPVRLVVPGWYGVASVKWLREIRIVDRPFEGYFQAKRYILPRGDQPAEPLRERRVRAIITNLVNGDRVTSQPQEIRGLAWSGNRPVTKVELSTDGGNTWQSVGLDPESSPYSWRQWRATWTPSASGDAHLKVRATDESGRTQPETAEWNYLGYANNGIQDLNVVVEA